ncbi:hypothetical protein QBC43DRAFT_320041 [Cladorrhinum sp. PSN259]|nr:hypothetical protein QBC43DRAFT_320041 [Cladorrhinum sp. PSN259]
MNSLPPELTTMILSHIGRHRSRYASVSQSWQHIIETSTFRQINITGTSTHDYNEFKQIFAPKSRDGPRRQTLVRGLEFCVVLPNVSQKRQSKMQSTKESAANNVAFTEAIVDFSSFLSSWLGETAGISLGILAVGNESYGGSELHVVDGPLPLRNYFSFVGFDRSTLAGLRPHSGGKLDVLPRIGELTLFEQQGRRLHPSVLQVLGEALPNTQRMDLTYFLVGRRRMELRRELRASFGRSLLSLATSLTHLTRLQIYGDDRDPDNQQFAPGNMLDEASSGRDMFSVGLRALSQIPSLQILYLDGCHILSAEVFEDSDGIDSSGSWPSLTHLRILSVGCTTPDGGWYMTGDPSSGDRGSESGNSSDYEAQSVIDSDDSDVSDFTPEHKWKRQDGMSPWHLFRLTPNEEEMVPFLLAMVRAVSRMPKMKKMEVVWDDAIEGIYYAPGEGSEVLPGRPDYEAAESFYNSPAGSPRWIFHLLRGFAEWEFPPELKNALTESVGEGNTRVGRLRSLEWMRANPGRPARDDEKF